jgi:hypothetical protein
VNVPDEIAVAMKVPLILLAQKPCANSFAGTILIVHQLPLSLVLHRLLFFLWLRLAPSAAGTPVLVSTLGIASKRVNRSASKSPSTFRSQS